MKKSLFILYLILVDVFICNAEESQNFKEQQLKYPRVANAFKEKESILKNLFNEKKLSYPPRQIFVRIFKRERILEVWIKESDEYILLKEYKICSLSGDLGPKREEGDRQIPEGFYYVNHFNPNSRFHLSLGISYPNESDIILGKKGKLGGSIYIHGSCVTIGCVPITDAGIKELYILAVQARSSGQLKIPVHIFPVKLNEENMAKLKRDFSKDSKNLDFWLNLKEGFDFFEKSHRLPRIRVNKSGQYEFNE